MPQFGVSTSSRGDTAVASIVVGGDYRIFDRAIANGLGALVAGEVMSLNEGTGTWRKLNGADSTVGVLMEPIAAGYAGTPKLPILQKGAVKLAALTGEDAGWVVGQAVGLLILC